MNIIKATYPLHYFVWENDKVSLEDALLQKKFNIDQIDTHKRTALMLAINLCKVDCVRILLRYGSDPTKISDTLWTPLQESIATGNRELVSLVQTSKNSWIIKEAALKIKRILDYNSVVEDFYFEIDWEYSSWRFNDTIPMIKRKLCYIFSSENNFIAINEIDVTMNTCYRHRIDVEKLANADEDFCGYGFQKMDQERISEFLDQPIFNSFLQANSIDYQKASGGIFSKVKTTKIIDEMNAELFTPNDLKVTFMRRTDHLSEDWTDDFIKNKANKMKIGSTDQNKQAAMLKEEESKKQILDNQQVDFNPRNINMTSYFNDTNSLPYDIGRVKRLISKSRNFKSSVWITKDLPERSLEHVKKYLDLAAYFNPFIMRLYVILSKSQISGFPLELNIPLYYAIYGKIQFTNLYGSRQAADFVNNLKIDKCDISEKAFTLNDLRIIDENEKISHFSSVDEQDQQINFAVHKSLIEYGNSDFLVQREFSLKHHKIINKPAQESFVDEETAMMQEAIHASLSLAEMAGIPPGGRRNSRGEHLTAEQEEILRKQEEEELKRIIELSLTDK